MPHKVNPIRFENAESNLELSNAVLDSLAATLVTSRLQRDLTDSTVLRNCGVALGHTLIALDAAQRAKGVVTVSTGNHGRAVAHMAKRAGARAAAEDRAKQEAVARVMQEHQARQRGFAAAGAAHQHAVAALRHFKRDAHQREGILADRHFP